MKLLIDSSVYIAFFRDNDVFHKESVAFIEKLSEDKNVSIVLPILVPLEIANVLYKKLSVFDEKKLLNSFNKYEKVGLDFESAADFMLLFKKINLRTSDAIIAACAKMENAAFVTWDEKLLKEAKKLTKVQTPKTFLNKALLKRNPLDKKYAG